MAEEPVLDIVSFDAGFASAAAGEDIDVLLFLLQFAGIECEVEIAVSGGDELGCGIGCVWVSGGVISWFAGAGVDTAGVAGIEQNDDAVGTGLEESIAEPCEGDRGGCGIVW